MTRKIRITIQLDRKQLDVFKKMSKETGAPVAELLRRAANLYLEKIK